MRQDRTGKIIANHFVNREGTLCSLVAGQGNNKTWVWTAYDAADAELNDGKGSLDQLALRMKTEEIADTFKESFDAAWENNKDKIPGPGKQVNGVNGVANNDDDDESDDDDSEEEEVRVKSATKNKKKNLAANRKGKPNAKGRKGKARRVRVRVRVER